MYLQITDRCNMECIHCIFDCSKEGYHMPLSVVKDFIEIIPECKIHHLTIGGGEPTQHPDFLEILELLMYLKKYHSLKLYMVTNGAMSDLIWEYLESYYDKFQISLVVSNDYWHSKSMVNKNVRTHKLYQRDLRGISNVIDYGRATRNRNQICSILMKNKHYAQWDTPDKCMEMAVLPGGHFSIMPWFSDDFGYVTASNYMYFKDYYDLHKDAIPKRYLYYHGGTTFSIRDFEGYNKEWVSEFLV